MYIIYINMYVCKYIYSEVMKTIQCAHPPYHHNSFVLVEHFVCHEPIFVLIIVLINVCM